jgi:Uma2 family endonuclease
MRDPVPKPMTLTDFESLLQGSSEKLELLEGEVLAFAGGSIAHGMLCTRLVTAIDSATKPPCQTFTSDVAVRIADRTTYVYPDVSHTCEELDANATAIVAPDLVIEVISPESKTRDRSEKLDAYRSIASVREYVLVDARRVWVCIYRRQPGNVWTDTVYGSDETIDIHTVGIRIVVAELYAGTGRLLSAERS